MSLTEKLHKRLDKEFILLSKRSPLPLDSFWYKLFYSTQVIEIVENNSANEDLSQIDKLKIRIEARKNFIINCVTATEVYFKDLVKTLPELNEEIKYGNGVKNLLNNGNKPNLKVNIWEAYEIFNKDNFRLGDILIYFYSFQNLNDIELVMGNMLNIKFLDLIEEYPLKLNDIDKDFFGMDMIVLKKDYPNWRKYLGEIFDMRHDFVHHINYRDKLGYRRVVKLFYNLSAFIAVTDEFIYENYIPSKRSKKSKK